MLMTEKEAGLKWCPHARLIYAKTPTMLNAATGGSNRIAVDGMSMPLISDQACCIGSYCMAWRWRYLAGDRAPAEEREGRDPEEVGKPIGYCGAFGFAK